MYFDAQRARLRFIMSSLTDSDGDLYLHLTPTLRSLAIRGVVRTYPKKAILINEGEEGDSLWVLLKGSVKANGSASFHGPNGLKLPLASAPANSDGRPVVYGVRPEHFTIADDGAEAEIVVVEPTGSETQVFAKLGGEQVVAVFRERHQFNPGDRVRLKPDPSLVHLFDQETGRRL